MCGIPSIGFSLLDERWDADFRRIDAKSRSTMAAAVLEHGIAHRHLPEREHPQRWLTEDLKGIRMSAAKRWAIGGTPLTNGTPLEAVPITGCAASSRTQTRAKDTDIYRPARRLRQRGSGAVRPHRPPRHWTTERLEPGAMNKAKNIDRVCRGAFWAAFWPPLRAT